jgi:hypothetical protein
MLRGITVHLGHPRPHNSRKSEAALNATKSRRIPAPDLSPSDFFFLGMLKELTSATSYSSPDELISTRCELIALPLKDQLGSVFKSWMKRIHWVIKHRGITAASE